MKGSQHPWTQASTLGRLAQVPGLVHEWQSAKQICQFKPEALSCN